MPANAHFAGANQPITLSGMLGHPLVTNAHFLDRIGHLVTVIQLDVCVDAVMQQVQKQMVHGS